MRSWQSETEIEDYPVYQGTDLGLTHTNGLWTLKVWAPASEDVFVRFYRNGSGDNLVDERSMVRAGDVWSLSFQNAERAPFYTIQTRIAGKRMAEVVDPYARMVGINGIRAYVGDPSDQNPEGWHNDNGPTVHYFNDIVVYELHVRDFSIDPSSGIEHKGKFLGFTEEETSAPSGVKTGLAHLKELGITHVHLLPSFDFRSIDETTLERNVFNWGYEPLNYNVPEGSYATDPYDPTARIRELKQLIKTLHDNEIGVILDVVYNHTGPTVESSFNQLVPDYYYRQWDDGAFSDASACGNETASERFMMGKFMKESMEFWVKEYHMDGFRVDLMGIHDIETMNEISAGLREINPSVFIYGEGWTAGPSPLPDSLRAIKSNTHTLDQISVFSDELRDGIKGHWNKKEDRGFVSAAGGNRESVKFGIVGAIDHPQVTYESVNYTDSPWAREPWQMMSYVSCHDDLTLWDKLIISNPDLPEQELVRMHKLANTIVLTSQGVPFLHGGVDFLRSKNGDHNSFESSDSVNSIKWNEKAKYLEVFEYYRRLIDLRKHHPAFRMRDANSVRKNLSFIPLKNDLLIGYMISNHANEDDWGSILVYFNGDSRDHPLTLPDGSWTSVVESGLIDSGGIASHTGSVVIEAQTALILHD